MGEAGGSERNRLRRGWLGMKIIETDFIAVLNRALTQKMRFTPEIAAWFIRDAAESFDVDVWEKNQKIAEKDRQTGEFEGFDCYYHPVIVPGTGQPANLEIVPYPKGSLTLCLREFPETVPYPGDKGSFGIHSDAIKKLPRKTLDELGICKIGGTKPTAPVILEDGQHCWKGRRKS